MQARQTAVLAISLAQTNVPNVPLPTNTAKCFVKDRFMCSIGLQLCHNFGGPLCSRNMLHIVLTLSAATSPVGSRLQSRWFPLILPHKCRQLLKRALIASSCDPGGCGVLLQLCVGAADGAPRSPHPPDHPRHSSHLHPCLLLSVAQTQRRRCTRAEIWLPEKGRSEAARPLIRP